MRRDEASTGGERTGGSRHAEGRPLGVEFAVASDVLGFLERQGGEFVLPARVRVGGDVMAPS